MKMPKTLLSKHEFLKEINDELPLLEERIELIHILNAFAISNPESFYDEDKDIFAEPYRSFLKQYTKAAAHAPFASYFRQLKRNK